MEFFGVGSDFLSLRIKNGLHADAVLALDGKEVTIGSGTDVNISLVDEGVEERHARLIPVETGCFALQALGQNVLVADKELEIGEVEALGVPSEFRVGSIVFQLDFQEKAVIMSEGLSVLEELPFEHPTGKFLGKRNATFLIAASVAAMMVFILVQAVIYSKPRSKSQRGIVSSAIVSASDSRNVSDDRSPLSDRALGQRVVLELAKKSLSALKVTVSAGVVIIEGGIEPDAMQRFHDVEKWFDTLYGAQYVWISKVTINSDDPKINFTVQAVWIGKNSNIVVNSQRYQIGSKIFGEFSLINIKYHEIVIGKGPRIINVRY